MARVALTVTTVTKTGVAAAAEANGDPTNGHVMRNTGRTMLIVRNDSEDTAYDVTFQTPGTVDGLAVADRVVEIPANTSRHFGRIPVNVFGANVAIDVENASLKLTAFEP